MKLDLSTLNKAIQRLDESLAFCRSDLALSDPRILNQFRMAAIQAYEYTYEISWKMLRRHLENISGSPVETDINFADLIRMGNEYGLLRSDWRQWKLFREMRSITSHTYDEAKAAEVFAVIPHMLEEARYLYDKLDKQND